MERLLSQNLDDEVPRPGTGIEIDQHDLLPLA
jgi:hypothetical protein